MTEDSAAFSPDPADGESPEGEGETRSADTQPRRGFSAEVATSILGDGLPVIDWPTFNLSRFANVSQQLTQQQNWLRGIVTSGLVPKDLIGNPAAFIRATFKPFADIQYPVRKSLAFDSFSEIAERRRRRIAAAVPKVDAFIWSGLADTTTARPASRTRLVLPPAYRSGRPVCHCCMWPNEATARLAKS